MKYNNLINDLLDSLDNLECIKEIKKLKKDLVNNKNLISDIDNYHLIKSVKLKKKLYEYPDYVKYLKYESDINLLINNIKKEFNFLDRHC